MNKELFSSMQRQLTPSPQARAELEERLAGVSPKKRPAFRWQYGAAAACLLLAVAAVPLWRQFNPNLHTVVQGEGNAAQAYQEDSAVTGEGAHQALSPDPDDYGSGSAGTGEAAAPEPLAGVSGWRSQPWFGGYYYDNAAGRYVIVTVEGEAVPELAFGDAAFVTGTYSYAHLSGLMDQLNELATADPECGAVMASWWIDEMENRVCLTITEENSHLLSILAQLDPAGDAILVVLGERVSTDAEEDIATYDVLTGEETVGSVSGQAQPGGQPGEGAIAVEPAAPEQSMPAAADFPEYPVSDQAASAYPGAGISSRG